MTPPVANSSTAECSSARMVLGVTELIDLTSVLLSIPPFLVYLTIGEVLENITLREERESKEVFSFFDVTRNPGSSLGIGLQRLGNPSELRWCFPNPSHLPDFFID